jgi:hypothetical protein
MSKIIGLIMILLPFISTFIFIGYADGFQVMFTILGTILASHLLGFCLDIYLVTCSKEKEK